MSAAGDPDAIPVCLLPHAWRRDRFAARTMALDSRSVSAGSMAPAAGRDHHHHAPYAAIYSTGWNGPCTTENDECHDAGHARCDQLESCCWFVSLLVRRKRYRYRAAEHHEPHHSRTRDARDDGKTRKK